MRLTDYTDYALRVLMYLGMRPTGLVTIQEIATAHGISKNHLTKVVHHLGLVDLVHTVRGRAGGIRLGVRPDQIRLGAVVRLTEPDFNMVECFDETQNHCALSPTCALKHALAGATDAYLERLDRLTLSDILHGSAKACATFALSKPVDRTDRFIALPLQHLTPPLQGATESNALLATKSGI
jgi:Rrf2 family transcriptional regulator, nitric oxide-sensitive transcriptional repressor